jgi:hypothetical protein
VEPVAVRPSLLAYSSPLDESCQRPLAALTLRTARQRFRNDRQWQAVTTRTRARFLHVTNGTCAAEVIEASGIPGPVSIWADPLYDGPVPGGLSDDELLQVRARYLAGDSDVDPVNDLRRWREVIEHHEAYDELVLWFEHDLFDQLNLLQLLTWIGGRFRRRTVSLVCIGSFPGRARFKGLGELLPAELAPLVEMRQPVTEEQYALASRAWAAFREPSPEALDRLRRTDTSALPYLASALTRFLEEYPWTTDGLSRTERRLLTLASGGAVDLATVFPRMHDDETAYYVTDSSLAELAESLARTPAPLLTMTAGAPPAGLLQRAVELTDTGRAVLSGDADRMAVQGIDRWLGGVHLRGDAPWRWDGSRQAITRN